MIDDCSTRTQCGVDSWHCSMGVLAPKPTGRACNSLHLAIAILVVGVPLALAQWQPSYLPNSTVTMQVSNGTLMVQLSYSRWSGFFRNYYTIPAGYPLSKASAIFVRWATIRGSSQYYDNDYQYHSHYRYRNHHHHVCRVDHTIILSGTASISVMVVYGSNDVPQRLLT